MDEIAAFQKSGMGVLVLAPPSDHDRIALQCATIAQVNACNWVPQDAMAWVDVHNPGVNIVGPPLRVGGVGQGHRIGLAHVRRATQLDSLRYMLGWVQSRPNPIAEPATEIDVYLVGGFAQTEPARSIVSLIEGNMIGYGAWKGVSKVYGHINKPYAHNLNRADNQGHIPGFVADVTVSQQALYPIGTSQIAGCIAVLAVPAGSAVIMRKLHIYDYNHNVHQGAAALEENSLRCIGFP